MEGKTMKRHIERIDKVRYELQSLIEDLYWGDIHGAKITDEQRTQANQVYLMLKGISHELSTNK